MPWIGSRNDCCLHQWTLERHATLVTLAKDHTDVGTGMPLNPTNLQIKNTVRGFAQGKFCSCGYMDYGGAGEKESPESSTWRTEVRKHWHMIWRQPYVYELGEMWTCLLILWPSSLVSVDSACRNFLLLLDEHSGLIGSGYVSIHTGD